MANIKKITAKEFKEMVLAEARKIKKELYTEETEGAKSLGYPTDQKMNKNDGLGDSDKALVYKNTKSTETKKGKAPATAPADVKMNANAKELGSDEKASAAVHIDAGAEKGGKGPTAGQHKANFESKKDNPKKEVSAPFVEENKDKLNSMDSNTDDVGTKTFVEAGAEKGGKGPTAGQHKAVVKEKAPVVKDKAPIIKGIETDQGNSNHEGTPKDAPKEAKKETVKESLKINLKESYTRKELIETVKREAAKIAKKAMLEEQLRQIDEELSNL
jgi:hypothetical protein